MDDRNERPGAGPDSDIGELAVQLGLSVDDAEAAWRAVLGELEQREAGAAVDTGAAQIGAGERFNAADLIDLFDGGKKPDLVDMAKDEIVKAVAEKLGIDPEKAGPVVDMILKMLDKPAPRRRRKTTKRKPKKATTGKRPSASSGGKKRPKAKPSASTRPAPKKKRPAAKPAASTAAKPKKKRTAAKPKPASSSSSARPRKRRAIRSAAATAGPEQA